MRTALSLLIICSLAISACRKKDPVEEPGNDPEFMFNGVIDNNFVNLTAGVGDYYMFTSAPLDSNGIYQFTGEFRQRDCSSGCPYSLKISLGDYRVYANGATSTDSSITPGYYAFSTPAGDTTLYRATFNGALYNGTAASYAWDFGDGTSSYMQPPVTHIYHHPGNYKVTLTIQSTNSSSSTISNVYHIGQAGDDLKVRTSCSVQSDTAFFSSSISGGVSGYAYSWDFGDATSGSGQNPQHVYAPGVYQATLYVLDGSGYTATHTINVNVLSPNQCYATLNMAGLNGSVPSPINLTGITIEWRDGSGLLWTTRDNNQPNTSSFKVLSVTDFQTNLNGQPTKKIHLLVSCTLYNGMNSYTIDNADVYFAVAHL